MLYPTSDETDPFFDDDDEEDVHPISLQEFHDILDIILNKVRHV